MKEARSVANALAAFAIFLLVWAFFVPGHARATRGPRFIRVAVEDLGMVEGPESRHDRDHGLSLGIGLGRGHDRGAQPKVSFSVDWAFVKGGLNAASTGRVRRELDLKLGDPIEGETLRGIWKELSTSPEGTEVTRTVDDRVAVFTRKGGLVTIHLGPEPDAKPAEAVEEAEKGDAEETETEPKAGIVAPIPPVPPVPPIPPVPQLGKHDGHGIGIPGSGDVVIVLPARLVEALAGKDEALSPLALIEALRSAAPGDLIDVSSADGRVKVWLE